MAKYALLKDGAFQNVVIAESDWTPPSGLTKVAYDPSVHKHTKPAEPVRVTPYRFLFELHAPLEQFALIALRKQANSMTSTEIATASSDEDVALVGLLNVEDRLGRLSVIETESAGALQYYAIAKGLGVFGSDSDLADLRIAAIKADQDPS